MTNHADQATNGQTQSDPQLHATGDVNNTNPCNNHKPSKDYMKIATLNMWGRTCTIQGYRQDKWFQIYRVINTSRTAILAIQETHLTDELANSVKSSFNTKLALHYSPLPETRNAAGVAFVINKGMLNADKVSCEEVIPGRALLATIAWHADTKIKILNVYAPNDPKNNENFWEKLNEIISTKPHLRPDVMLGDFNLVEDSLDRLPCHPDNVSAVAALEELKSTLNLVDGWRRTNPDKRKYSHLHTPNASQGRIDRIYITNHLLPPAKEWKIDPPIIETDHWLVSAKITTPETPEVGKGRWQIPTYLFDNEDIIEEINTMGKEALDEIEINRHRRTHMTNPQTIFAKFKAKIVALCRNKAKVVHPTITNKIDKLRKRLDLVNNNENIPEDDRMLESIVVKTEILELERILFESNRVYAKAKHHVHAETICRDWIRTNRQKKPRDTIFSLYNPLDESPTPTYDSREMAELAKRYHENLQTKDRDPTSPPDQTKLEAVLENITSKVTQEQKSVLARHLKWGDIHTALSDSANDKAAGLDGIPISSCSPVSINLMLTNRARFINVPA